MLSRHYSHYRPDEHARWTKIHGREHCDECLAVQHETHGTTRRQPARHTRTTGTATLAVKLHLCVVHTEEWKARDRGE